MLRPIDHRDRADFERCAREARSVTNYDKADESTKRRIVREAWRRREALGFVVRGDGIVCRKETR